MNKDDKERFLDAIAAGEAATFKLDEGHFFNWQSVTGDWIQEQIADLQLERKDVCDDLEITKGDLSAYINGKKNISDVRKQAFFGYFQAKWIEKYFTK